MVKGAPAPLPLKYALPQPGCENCMRETMTMDNLLCRNNVGTPFHETKKYISHSPAFVWCEKNQESHPGQAQSTPGDELWQESADTLQPWKTASLLQRTWSLSENLGTWTTFPKQNFEPGRPREEMLIALGTSDNCLYSQALFSPVHQPRSIKKNSFMPHSCMHQQHQQ